MTITKKRLEDLISTKEDILKQIRMIQENCEGIDNKANANKVSSMNNEKAELLSKKNKIKKDLDKIENKLVLLNTKIIDLSSDKIDKLLEAVNKQRWFFLKNKPKVILDSTTGNLWANINYFDIYKDEYLGYYIDDLSNLLTNLDMCSYTNWKVPEKGEFINLYNSNEFPFSDIFENKDNWFVIDHEIIKSVYCSYSSFYDGNNMGKIIPCNTELTNDLYKANIKDNNKVYSKKERSQFKLDFFLNNNLEPIFDDEEITRLYRSIYIEKPMLLNNLNEIQQKIDELQQEVLLSSTFDYKSIFINYDIKEIDTSVIKYYKAIQSWIDDLISKIQYFEEVKWDIIREFDICGLKLSKKYEDIPKLDEEENILLKNRQAFLRKNMDLGMNSVKSKLLSVKSQADNIELRIEEINDSENSILRLAELEEEKRASFNFIAENTANIIKGALVKVEYFEANKDFVVNIINSESKWSENYKVFKTKDKEELRSLSEDDGVEEDIYMSWYEDWRNKKYLLEERFTELIKQCIKKSIVSIIENENESKYMIEEVVSILEQHNKDIDDFYKNERKNIHQKYAFVPGGDIQEKLEVESNLYKITVKFQNRLQDIIFKLDSIEDRMFLFKWAESIIDLQVNEVLYFIKEKDFNKISEVILNQFADLKRSNIDNCISDAQLYSEEKSSREKQFNSLMYKMRKELMA